MTESKGLMLTTINRPIQTDAQSSIFDATTQAMQRHIRAFTDFDTDFDIWLLTNASLERRLGIDNASDMYMVLRNLHSLYGLIRI